MHEPGPLLASGRDADIFEYGNDAVLRRARDGRSLALEARTMTYVAQAGYPVPAVLELSDDGRDLVMARVRGRSMVEEAQRRPWSMLTLADTLADLHARLHAVEPPDFLASAPLGSGDRLVHLDLHPLNVLVGRDGPVVIDWSGASIGDPRCDVALAYLLMSGGEVTASRLARLALEAARSAIARRFLSHFDRHDIAQVAELAATWKATDANMAPHEVAAMHTAATRLVASCEP